MTSPPRPSTAPVGTIPRPLAWLAQLQLQRPWLLVMVAIALVAASTTLALDLRVIPGFEALLPQSRPSVVELNRVKEHTTGISTVFVVLEGDDTAALRKAADAVVIEVGKIGRPWVGSAESGVHDALDFMKPRAGLFASLEALESLRDDVEERWNWEVGKASGQTLEEDDYEPPQIDGDTLRKRFGIEDQAGDRYPDGYYQSQDGKAVVVTIRSAVLNTDYDGGNEAIRKIEAAVETVNPKGYHASTRYGLSGDLVTGMSEYNAVRADLTEVGIIGGIAIILVVFLYYLRIRTLWSMLVTIGIGVSCTFGITELLIGRLNMATGFLFTIVAGNGINPGIIYMARFLEARRKGMDTAEAVRRAHRDTWLPTLTASCAASAAYGSLIVTEFHGFRDFGVIGGFGMVLCWLCTFAFLPAFLVLSERYAPLNKSSSGLFGLLPKATSGGTRFGQPFASLVAKAPRAATIIGLSLTAIATIVTVGWVRDDPMEYDLTKLRTDMSQRREEVRLSKLAEKVTGFVGLDGMAILVDKPAQVPLLVEALNAKRAAAPDDKKPFKQVVTLQDFVPEQQAAKIPILMALRKKVVRSHKRGFIEDVDYEKVRELLPPVNLAPFDIKGLPLGVARSFTEADGTRGRIVYISPTSSELIDDAHYLFRWANAYRRTELSDGSVVLGSGRAVIYADIWEAIIEDVPKAVLVSLLLTLFVVAIAFRKGFASAAVMASLLAGVLWMTALLAGGNVKLNFLNFIALPITFGIGVDYAVNVMQRYRREGRGGALTAVRETGGAVVLCSLTTTLGYLALVRSMNYAVRSLGIAAVLGELACLVTAVIILPAALTWRDRVRDLRDSRAANASSS